MSSQKIVYTDNGVLYHHISWTPSSDDSWRINFAGQVAAESKNAGAGFILRDQNAKFKAAYAAPVRNCNLRLEAELVGLKHGLVMAIRHGVDYLEIEGDYSIEMRVLAGEQIIPSSANINKLAKKCSYLLKQFFSVKICQVDFDSNQGANEVAAIGINLKKHKKWLGEPPSNIYEILITDVIGRWIYKPMP
ncbi:hypothetical protein Dsin_007156 [Dipteronia sinensis]|uniref:RNase H type-1 domain-containing protein n=1 Tax=Dipteronia sinensis TaxID=43782 RepID=A0AAE0B125_9ROSI|nr:hypothetical protein Dsin_007156 [Dipteronia sinensis]